MVRSTALTIPEVTVFASASGEPNASTGSPTLTAAESPSCTGVTPGVSTRITARSDSGSRPTSSAVVELPSRKVTIGGVDPLPTTWSLVSTWPWLEITNPEPRLVPPRPLARIVTTLGSTRSATAARLSGGRCASAAGAVSAGAPRVTPPASRVARV